MGGEGVQIGRRIAFVSLAALACLLLTGALSSQHVGHTHAWFTGYSQVDANITTDYNDDTWYVDYVFVEGNLDDLTVGGSGTVIDIGYITSKTNNLRISCSLSGSILNLHTCTFSSPSSFVLNSFQSQDILLLIKATGNNKGKTFQGTVTLTFDDYPDVSPINVDFTVFVPR